MTTKKDKIILRYIFMFLFISISVLCISQELNNIKQTNVIYFGKEFFLLEGTEIVDSLKENLYDRLPISYKQIVRQPVWVLSKASAGMSIRFLSNSTSINVRWILLNNNTMNHMAETGIKGIDLYFKNNENWQYVNTARPTGKENEALLISNMSNEMREYKMFLPLYDGVVKIEVGIDSNSMIEKPVKSNQKSIVFYGTSITQGGCASRPGMVYTSIISRKLNVNCVNFGFSGNGKMEQPIVELISEIDALFYVIECLPNMNYDEVINSTIPLVKTIREKQPATPIIFVENFVFEQAFLDKNMSADIIKKNIALKNEYTKMIENGYQNIFYIESINATGSDHEGTVDGVHFTDLGFIRYADYLIDKFKQFGLIIKTVDEKK
jgi:hypothetical protein